MNLLENIKNAGVVGAGGAGFPAHIKLDRPAECLIVNAAECEPLLLGDKYIMKAYADDIVEAAEKTADLVMAKRLVFAVKGVNRAEIEALKRAGEKSGSRAEIFELDNYYPAGDEQMVVYDVTGRAVPPGGIPLDVGVAVSNVATMLNIHGAISGRPVTERILTVTGAVKNPQVLRVPVGISFASCIEAAGGSELEKYRVIDGGPMMGSVLHSQDAAQRPVTKTTSGIIVIPEGGNFASSLLDLRMERTLNRAKSACIQCSFCTDMCPRWLTGHPLRPHMVMRRISAARPGDIEKLKDDPIRQEAALCCECGICEAYACPMKLSPRQVNKYFKKLPPGSLPKTKVGAGVAHSMRDARKIAPYKIMARMGLQALYGKKEAAFSSLKAGEVKIPLKQHIGAPAVPVVAAGDNVAQGQLIARLAEGAPSANIHASISGAVTEVSAFIVIVSP